MEDLDFKSIYANYSLSAAITVSGDLYIWGAMNISNMTHLLGKIIVVKNESKTPMIIDKIELNKGKLFALARILENKNYVKKLFSLEIIEQNYGNPYVLKEIKLVNFDDNNSRLVPLKVFIDDNKSYVLCVDENKFIKEIKENHKKDKLNLNYEISISNYNENDYRIEKIKEIYSSDKLNNFISLFKSLSDKNISDFIDAIEQIKDKSKGKIKTENIDFNQLINHLKGKNEMKKLLAFFDQKDNNEIISIFNYLKIKKSLVEKNLLNYVRTCIEPVTEEFFKKVISNSILYLSGKSRIEYFFSLLSNKIKNNEKLDFENQRSHNIKIQINVDRLKAKAFYDKYNENSKKIKDIELKEIIFGQVFHSFEKAKINENEFLLNKGDRLFRVNLIGENAIDAGGPYHEVISYMCGELQSNYCDLFIKTPNNENNSGLLTDKYIPNPNSNKNIHKKAYIFIGKLFGMALSSGEALNLNLHPIIWKDILENEITFEDYKFVDINFYNNIKELEKGLKEKDLNLLNIYDLTFVIDNSNKSKIKLIENGSKIKVNLENLEEFINLAKKKRINEIEIQMEYIKKGLYSVIEKNLLKILNWQQLEEMICSKKVLDIQDFKEHTKYRGYNGNEEIIKWFWDWLEKSNEIIQMKYLKFVSGRTRLQKAGFGYDYKHIISRSVHLENSFPKALTCFFRLDLPNYNSQKIFMKKINYSIENCSDISDN